MSPKIRSLLQASAFVALIGGGAVYATLPASTAEMTVEVGGAAMYPSKNIIENAVNSKDHTTLVAAVKAAGLVETLESPGPFTVFAPVNAAFDKLPAGTVETLLKPENKDQLVAVLTYHVVPGTHSAKDIMADIDKMGGKAEYKTVEGDMLTFSMKDGKLWVWDESGELGAGDHRRRQSVERRHPRHRHCASAEDGLTVAPVNPSETEGSGPPPAGCFRCGSTVRETDERSPDSSPLQRESRRPGAGFVFAIALRRHARQYSVRASQKTRCRMTMAEIKGGKGNDKLDGTPQADDIFGKAGNDKLFGGDGDDFLLGGPGKDKLTGGAGFDAFFFDSKPGKNNVDKVVDFVAGEDTFQLSVKIFKHMGFGNLKEKYFHVGAHAHDGNDHIILDPDTGTVYYDADGKGGEHQQPFMQVNEEIIYALTPFDPFHWLLTSPF